MFQAQIRICYSSEALPSFSSLSEAELRAIDSAILGAHAQVMSRSSVVAFEGLYVFDIGSKEGSTVPVVGIREFYDAVLVSLHPRDEAGGRVVRVERGLGVAAVRDRSRFETYESARPEPPRKDPPQTTVGSPNVDDVSLLESFLLLGAQRTIKKVERPSVSSPL